MPKPDRRPPSRSTDPTPVEIAEACRLIREGWGPREYLERSGYVEPQWEFPRYHVDPTDIDG